MRRGKRLIPVLALCLVSGQAAWGLEAFKARIQVSSGGLYDYVLIGERPEASDDYDNAYDIVSPGNLNASMGEGFINAVVSHPEWKPALQELRGDMRSASKKQQWILVVTSSLERETTLRVELKPEAGALPTNVRLVLRDEDGGKAVVLSEAPYLVPAPGKKQQLKFELTAEQK
ncbi:hypothetical protein M1B72_09160 [Geomonas paludis]|uniref:Uncharacterized protein n=1 Tax=Geomonas paludis TaxID=2740185 RepID=A0ABY4LM61_9BACT|nr:hypothetical protein [Geomonas paludis]UPU37858.1 hypothetical protein M1B72_09160 [Geomonas paludis]